jgi:hypothetical protein
MASKDDGPYQNDNAPPSKGYVPAPIQLYAFPDARRVRGKTPRPGGGVRQRWKSRSGLIYEWDYLHGCVEVYDRRGRHLGEFDPTTGARTKPANPDYQVEP